MRAAKGIVSRTGAMPHGSAGWLVVGLLAAAAVRHIVPDSQVVELRALLDPASVRAAEVTYTTRLGAHIRRELPDHSFIDQNTETVSHARISPRVRELTLERGEAVVNVASNARVPMVIRAGELAIRADSGTVWLRATSESAWRVGVLAGSLEIDCRSGGIRTVSLRDGDIATLGPNSLRVEANSAQELVRQTAWRRSQIWLSGQTLAEAAAEFNRYNERKIIIRDQQTASIRVGGRFYATELDTFVRALGPLHVEGMTVSQGPQSRKVILLFRSKTAI